MYRRSRGSWRRLILAASLPLLFSIFRSDSAYAFPDVAFTGSADAAGVDVSLVLVPAVLAVDIDVARQHADLAGAANTPVSTSGRGDGIDVAVVIGSLAGAAVDIVNASSNKTYDGNSSPVTDADSLVNVDTLLVDTGIIGTNTSSQVTGTLADSFGQNGVNGLSVYRNSLGTLNLVTANTITSTVQSQTNTVGPNHDVVSTSSARIEGAAVSLGPLLGLTDPVVTADLIQANASATNDGTVTDMNAAASVSFVNLMVNGVNLSAAPPNTVVNLLVLGVPVARVTVRPIIGTTITQNLSTARTVALRIEVLAVAGLVGTTIDLGVANAAAAVGNTFNGNSGPLALALTGFAASVTPPGGLALPLSLGMAVAVLPTVIVVLRRRGRKGWKPAVQG